MNNEFFKKSWPVWVFMLLMFTIAAVGNYYVGTFSGNGTMVTNAAGAMLDVTKTPFNAAGDGVTDDTAAFTSALTASAAGGLPVYVPNRTYKVSPFTVYANQAMYGQNGARLLFSAGSSGTAILVDSGATNCALSGLEIDGGNPLSMPSSDDGRKGLLIFNDQNQNCHFDHLYIHGFGRGIELFGVIGGSDPSVGFIHHILIQYCYDAYQIDSQAEYNGFTALYAYGNYYGLHEGAGNNTFVACHFDFNNINASIDNGNNAGHSMFIGCTFNHYQSGYSLVSSNLSLGCVFDSCAFLPPNLYLTNGQGFSFENCLIGWNVASSYAIAFDHCTNCAILWPQNPYGVANTWTLTTTTCSNLVYQQAIGTTAGFSIADAQLSTNAALYNGSGIFSALNANGIKFASVNGPSQYDFGSVNTFSGDSGGFQWNNQANGAALATMDNTGNFALANGQYFKLTSHTTTPPAATVGANNSILWVSNGVLYATCSANGTTVTTTLLANHP